MQPCTCSTGKLRCVGAWLVGWRRYPVDWDRTSACVCTRDLGWQTCAFPWQAKTRTCPVRDRQSKCCWCRPHPTSSSRGRWCWTASWTHHPWRKSKCKREDEKKSARVCEKNGNRMRMEIRSGRIWPDRMGTKSCSYHVCEEHIRGRVSPRLCAGSIAAFYVRNPKFFFSTWSTRSDPSLYVIMESIIR